MKTALAIPLILSIFIFGNLFSKKSVVNDRIDEVFENITMVDIKGAFLNVTVNGSDNKNVKVEGEIKSNRDNDDFSFEYAVNDGVLTVWIERPNAVINTGGYLNFTVPEHIDLKIYNSSGSVKVDNISSDNEVKLQTSSGSLQVGNINANLFVKASSGSVKLNNIYGDTRVETSSGGISASGIKGDVFGDSSSGSQNFNDITGKINTKSSSGSLKFMSLKGNLTARSNSGSIKLDGVTGALNLTSSSGSQLGNNVRLTDNSDFKSSSGSIVMNFLNESTELRFMLQSKSGSLTAYDKKASRNLKTLIGDIYVKGYSNSGSQKYY